MYSLLRLNNGQLPCFRALTFPYFRRLIEQGDASLQGIGLELCGEPVGLALGSIMSGQGGAELHSLYIRPDCRRQGWGRRLLQELERMLAEHSPDYLTATYATHNPNAPVVARLLRSADWPEAQPRLMICQSDWPTVMRAPWIQRFSFPADYELFSWSELRPDERDRLVQSGRCGDWFPVGLDPLRNEDRLLPELSFGLRWHGKLVGWSLAHRFDARTAQFAALFVDESIQRLGRAVSLLAVSIRAMEGTGRDKLVCEVALDNAPMLRFVERRLGPYCTSVGYILRAWKPVRPALTFQPGATEPVPVSTGV